LRFLSFRKYPSDMKARKALSRILVEVLLIVIVLAALAGAYFIYSMYAGSATTQFSAIVLDAYASDGGSGGTDRLVVNVKNTGAMTIDKATIVTPTGFSDLDLNIKPGMSGTLEFDASSDVFSAGQQYTIILKLSNTASGQSVNLVFKVTAI